MTRGEGSRTWVMQGAVIVSVLAHVSLIAAAGLRRERAAAEDPSPPADTWAGTTSLPSLGELHEVDLSGGESGSPTRVEAPAQPTQVAESVTEPTQTPAPQPTQVAENVMEHTPTPAPQPTQVAENVTEPTPSPTQVAASKPTAPKPDRPRPRRPKPKPKAPKPETPLALADVKPQGGTPSTEAPPGPAADKPGEPAGAGGGTFGAVGTAQVRDLGRAFTRALPPACDADKTWSKLPVGSAGSVEIAVSIGEDGKIRGIEPLSPSPPAHLVSAAKRTMALLRGGIFALKGGSVTSGRQILKLSAELSDTTPPDESSGAGAFKLASRWEGKRGVASFTQTSGRHVEITIEFLRIEATPG